MEVYDRMFLRSMHHDAVSFIEGMGVEYGLKLDNVLKAHAKRSKRRSNHRGIYTVSAMTVKKNLKSVTQRVNTEGKEFNAILTFNNLEIDDMGAYIVAFRLIRQTRPQCTVVIFNDSVKIDINDVKKVKVTKFKSFLNKLLRRK